MQKAWSVLEIKRVDPDKRIVEGIATTPTPDRGGDIMVPAGAEFSLPMPFLWFHDTESPIGEVFAADVREDGIYIKARVSKVSEPGRLKTLTDEAWAAFTANPPLVRGLSIGWKPKDEDGAVEPVPGTSFIRFWKWIWGELSAVTVPMNTDATILSVKQADQDGIVARLKRVMETASEADKPTLQEAISIVSNGGYDNTILVHPTLNAEEIRKLLKAASGQHTPGVTGTATVVRVQKDAPPMTTAEQITSFEAKRQANVAQMNALMTKSAAAGETLNAADTETYTTLEREVESIDAHLPRLKKLEQMNIANATAITTTTTAADAAAMRGGHTPTQVSVTSNLPKGTAFIRYAMSLAGAKGDSYRALSRAESYKDTPQVLTMVKASLEWGTKAAVAAGTTTDSTWAGPLVVAQPLVDEFIELLRPRTLIGRIPRLRQVPFNVSVPTQTAGGTYGWVGQGKAKPVTKNDFSTTTLTWAKAAGIIVLTEELVKVSSPSAEALVREDMIAGIQKFLDEQLVDPAVTAVADTNPASITNGATSAAASGTTGAAARADIAAQIAAFAAAEVPLDGMVILMNESNAFALGLALNALGQPLFPGVSQSGGTLMGIPVIVSNSVGARIVFIHAPSILFADDGGVNIDTSREASIQMDSAPTEPTADTTVLVSLWQRNLVGLRAERFITWKRARTAAVRYISSAAYTGA